MSVSKYRKEVIDRVKKHKSTVDRKVNSILNLSDSNEKLAELIAIVNDNGATAEQKTGALSMLNAVSNFSSAARKLQPEIVNTLRGQIEAPDQDLRLSAISTLAALKDDVVQERLLEEITSDKPEEERLVPTASALALLGRDEKALSSSVLQGIISNPPNDESLIEAVRQMPSDPDACEALISLMKDNKAPLAAREMIPEMVAEADPTAFLSAAEDMLKSSGAEDDLAPRLVKGVSMVTAPEAAKAVESTKKVVAKLRDNAPKSFQSVAGELLDKDDSTDN